MHNTMNNQHKTKFNNVIYKSNNISLVESSTPWFFNNVSCQKTTNDTIKMKEHIQQNENISKLTLRRIVSDNILFILLILFLILLCVM